MRTTRIIEHETELQLKRILQPERFDKRIKLYWALNAQRIIDIYLEHYWRNE